MDEFSREARATLELSLCEGVSSGTIFSLVEHFGSAVEALEAAPQALQEVNGIGPTTAASIRRGPDAGAVEKELDLMERHRVRLVPFTRPRSNTSTGGRRHCCASRATTDGRTSSRWP